MQVILIKMMNGETITINPHKEVDPSDVFNEMLGNQKEFIQVGLTAISKRQVVYVVIQEVEAPQTEEKKDGSASDGECSGGGNCGPDNASGNDVIERVQETAPGDNSQGNNSQVSGTV